jgi:hypothetical protein
LAQTHRLDDPVHRALPAEFVPPGKYVEEALWGGILHCDFHRESGHICDVASTHQLPGNFSLHIAFDGSNGPVYHQITPAAAFERVLNYPSFKAYTEGTPGTFPLAPLASGDSSAASMGTSTDPRSPNPMAADLPPFEMQKLILGLTTS